MNLNLKKPNFLHEETLNLILWLHRIAIRIVISSRGQRVPPPAALLCLQLSQRIPRKFHGIPFREKAFLALPLRVGQIHRQVNTTPLPQLSSPT